MSSLVLHFTFRDGEETKFSSRKDGLDNPERCKGICQANSRGSKPWLSATLEDSSDPEEPDRVIWYWDGKTFFGGDGNG
jgi:hypothetical protein